MKCGKCGWKEFLECKGDDYCINCGELVFAKEKLKQFKVARR